MAHDWKAERRRVWILAVARAFTITMSVITLVALGAAINQIANAHADSPICEHRGEAHAAQQHTTREADSRWHVEHGQLPTCDLSKGDDHGSVEDHRSSSGNLDQKDDRDDHPDKHDDDKLIPGHRDHEGFHCYRLHCG